MPWIAKAKESYRNIWKDHTYIVRKHPITDIIQVRTKDDYLIMTLAIESCRQLFHPPQWVNK